MQQPPWATEIIKEVCFDHNRKIPSIVWRQRKGARTSGSTYLQRDRIVITLGTESADHKRVLLHELAHYLNQSGRQPHGKEFYLILRALFITYNCLDEYRHKESRYRASAALYL